MTTVKYPIAIVDDDPLHRSWLSEALEAEGYPVIAAEDAAGALALVQASSPALLLLDLRLPDRNALEILEPLRELDHDLPIIIMTAYGEIETAVQAVKLGAYDFLEKPLDANGLMITVDQALEARRLRREVASYREQNRWHFADVELVGKSLAMKALVDMVSKIAKSDSATVLLRGESGTGKDLVARAIHRQSARGQRPFLTVNCTSLPDQLLESELFGHERGAFTDARERKKGLAELADGGTLFLDEIGDMHPSGQAKLLRFLEDSSFRRLGGTADLVVDVRVIAATNRDLERAVAEQDFRDDLFYRLNVLPVMVPPLRARSEDVEPLTTFFLEKLASDLRRDVPVVSQECMRLLESYSWPGNVRELRNVLERLMILEDVSELRSEHLPPEIRNELDRRLADSAGAYNLPPEGVRLEDVETALIEQALSRSEGNVTQAAQLLGISRDTLRYRMEKRGMTHNGEVKDA